MAKQITQCGCGGSFDGTPSGKSKHIATAKHIGWVVGQQNAGRKGAKAAAEALAANEPQSPDPDPHALPEGATPEALDTLVAALSGLIADKEIQLAARQIDHKYRERHTNAERAGAYYSARVAPLREEIEVLRAARKAVSNR